MAHIRYGLQALYQSVKNTTPAEDATRNHTAEGFQKMLDINIFCATKEKVVLDLYYEAVAVFGCVG